MKLTRKQIAEIVEYDHDERERCRWDARRYGSISNPDSIPEGRVNVPTPRPAECCVDKAEAVLERKTLRYNYIVPDHSGDHRKRGVTVCHVGVRLTKDYRPRVKILSMAHLAGKGCKTILSGDIDYRMVAGWVVTWESEELSRKNDAKVDVTSYGRWWRVPYGEYAGLAFPWHATINPDALSDTRYRWCGWRPGCGIGLINFLDLYDRFPKIEFLAKANLFPLVRKAGISALRNPSFMEWVRKNAKSLSGKWFSVRSAVYAWKHGCSVAAAKRYFEFVRSLSGSIRSCLHWCEEWDAKKMRLNLDYARVRRALPKWGVSQDEYARYVKEAVSYGLDVRSEGVLYPPVRDGRRTFMERLERLEAENQRRYRREERRRKAEERKAQKARREAERRRIEEERAYIKRIMASRLSELDDFQKSVDRIREIPMAGLTCVVAKSQKELLKEGRRMNNCVGGGTYGRGIVFGSTLILMFRDKDGKSWCDAEIDRSNWKIRQCYLRGNDVAPDSVHRLAASIAGSLRKVHAAHKKSHAYPELEAGLEKERAAV